jgi:hypothetical protein
MNVTTTSLSMRVIGELDIVFNARTHRDYIFDGAAFTKHVDPLAGSGARKSNKDDNFLVICI